MNKRLLVSAFLFFFVFSLILLSQEDSTEKKIWEDERVSIIVDKVERTDSYPEMFKQPSSYGQTTTYRPPWEGNDYVIINIIIVEKRDLKVISSEIRLTKSQLVDDRGKTHRTTQQLFNITKRERKPVFMFFEMPKDATPVQLKYYYQYREEPPESQEIKIGQLDIDLTHIQ